MTRIITSRACFLSTPRGKRCSVKLKVRDRREVRVRPFSGQRCSTGTSSKSQQAAVLVRHIRLALIFNKYTNRLLCDQWTFSIKVPSRMPLQWIKDDNMPTRGSSHMIKQDELPSRVLYQQTKCESVLCGALPLDKLWQKCPLCLKKCKKTW